MTTREPEAQHHEHHEHHERHEHLDAVPRPAGADTGPFPAFAMLTCGGTRLHLRGRTLHLVLWLTLHQDRVNIFSRNAGQLQLTWQGRHLEDIEGDLHINL